MAEYCKETDFAPLPDEPAAWVMAELDHLRTGEGGARAADLRAKMQKVMTAQVGVFREAEGMQKAFDAIRGLKKRYCEEGVRLDDKGSVFNYDLLEAWELGALLDLAEVTAFSALKREESRGAHSRDDFPKRDDVTWLKHTLAYLKPDGRIELRYKPVVITNYQPKARAY